jgi:Carboxypeptidase regulatory-like domain
VRQRSAAARSILHLTIIRLAAAGMILSASPLKAQILYGSIVGNVKDSQGGVIPGATVTATNTETNLTRETVTNDEGGYSLTNVLPGPYAVKITMTGFREAIQANVPVTIGQISRVDLTLQVGAVTETVTVESAAQLLQTDKADVSTKVKSAEITNLPLNQFRNYQGLINLVPGATPAQFQNAETDTPARSLSTNVNGQNRNNNATRTDGAANVNIFLPHHNMYVSPAETIDTVNISTSNFDAEQGMAGGAAITVITKSGTNEFRGSAFEFFNDETLNARPYFFGNAAAKPEKLPIDSNIFGGTLGGPIKRNRVFFFGSYEGYKRSQNIFFRITTFRALVCEQATSAAREIPMGRSRSSTIQQPATPTARAVSLSRTTRFRPTASTESLVSFWAFTLIQTQAGSVPAI